MPEESESESTYSSYCEQLRLVPDAMARMTGSVELVLADADADADALGVGNDQNEAVEAFWAGFLP